MEVKPDPRWRYAKLLVVVLHCIKTVQMHYQFDVVNCQLHCYYFQKLADWLHR